MISGLRARTTAGSESIASRSAGQIVLRSVLRFAKDKGHISDAPKGLPRLNQVEQSIGARDGHVALSERGTPWGQYSLDQAFERVRNRVALEGWSIYCLRHYAITLWLRRGVPVHVDDDP